MPTEANAINAATVGIVGNTGTAFTGTATTQYNVIVGGATSSTLANVAPSAAAGIPLVSQGSASDPSFSTALVVGGGTGDTSFIPYSVVCGGTTGTGNLQNVASVGTAGQVLTSNGAAALPTWQSGAGVFSTKNQVFTSSGTYTPTAGMVYCSVEVVGGGGGSGGCAATSGSQFVLGTAGSGAEYARGIFSAATIGASQTVTIGAAGAAGVAGNNAGGSGGTTSVGILITAVGGVGGSGGAAFTGQLSFAGIAGGAGGSGGDFRVAGNKTSQAFASQSAGFIIPMDGGNSFYGVGGIGTIVGVGTAGAGYGAGGGGSTNNNSQPAIVGRAGTAGIVVIQEYIT